MNEDYHELIALIQDTHCLLRGQHGKGWDARAVDCTQYAHGATPQEAMRAAIAFRDNKPVTRRRAEFL